MCRIIAVTGSMPIRQVRKFLGIARASLADQKDGFGFVVADNETRACGRYLHPSNSLFTPVDMPSCFAPLEEHEGVWPSEHALTVIAHGRTSTNTNGLDCVHPFVSNDGTALVHNGILDWTGSAKERPEYHPVDSARFAYWLTHGGDWHLTKKNWSGYGAFAVHHPIDGLTIAKCDTASLYVAKRRKSRGWIYATSLAELVRVAKKANLPIQAPYIVRPGTLIWHAQDGSIERHSEWKGFGSRSYDYLASKSLGGTSSCYSYQSPKSPTATQKLITSAWDGEGMD